MAHIATSVTNITSKNRKDIKIWLMELDMLIRSALSDAQWLIAKGGTDRAETLNRVLGKIGNVLKELDGAAERTRWRRQDDKAP